VPVSPCVVSVDPDAGEEMQTLGPSTGFERLEQSLVQCAPGARLIASCGPVETVMFVLGGSGEVRVGGSAHKLEPESGVYLAPGEDYELECTSDEPLRLVRVRIPDPDPADGARKRRVVRRLSEQQAQDATTDREFRVVADPDSGLRSATHFVGYIPTARAPEHFHTYDEVIYVLDGEGFFHAGELHERVGPGSCIQLPARTVHSLENTGADTMRVVAVFRPAGSPAAAYYPDGRPAYTPQSK
jgi:quercetin dioxygenase-like cupin family protein